MGILGGTGHEGRGLAARLAAHGVPVLLGSRSVERAREAVERIAGGRSTVEAVANDDVVARCDLVVLAVPFATAPALLESYRERLRPGTVVVDLTVPLTFEGGSPDIVMPPEGSAAEHLRTLLPAEVGLAATLKTIPAWILGKTDEPLDCDEFVCADSPDATRRVVEALAPIEGLRLIDAGGLDAARTLERMTLLAVGINRRYRVRTARFRVVGV